MEIKSDDLSNPAVTALLEAHFRNMQAITPTGHAHVLDLGALKKPEITFWSVWAGDSLAGCGALKELDPYHGEIESMRTATEYLRKGVATFLLEYILNEARRLKYRRVSLETGSFEAFTPARLF